MEHHIVRTMEITGYQNTVSRGDIVVLDDKAYGTFDTDLTELQQQLLYTWCSSRGISYKNNIGGAVTDNWESLDKYGSVLPINNPSKYHAKFKEDILKLSDNYVKVINERDSRVSKVLSTVKSA